MRHPKRAITRDIRTRKPKRPDRPAREEAEGGWPERTIRARDVMTRPPVTFRQAMTVGAAARAMRTRRIRHAPVVDESGQLIGIVSDRDLREVIMGRALQDAFEEMTRTLANRTLKDVMTWGAVTVAPDTPLRQVAHVLHANKIGAVPVVDGKQLIGMLAAGDVLKTLIRLLDEGAISQPGRWGIEA
jgi:acetoin utilization protein AcuB